MVTMEKAFIGGLWEESESGAVFEVFDPADGNLIAKVSDCTAADAEKAIESASTAFKGWKKTTAKERASFLHRIKEELLKGQNNIATVLSKENGKPLPEAMGEVAFAASFFEWFAEETRRNYGDHIPAPLPGKEIVTIRQPAGVVGVITPWNFPIGMLARKVAALLAAGCTCVVKPAEDTPLTAIAFAKVIERINLPSGVFNLIPSSRTSAPSIGKAFAENETVSVLSFTGSTAVGKHLYSLCAGTAKRLALEMGGNAPFIVFKSANLDLAVQGAMIAKWRNAGQTCVTANRILVEAEVHDEFVAKFVELSKNLKVGRGLESGVTIGPIINDRQFKRVSELLSDAVSKGAQVVLGGSGMASLGRTFHEPTILTNVSENMRVFQEEIFGPVAAIMKFQTEAEGLRLANHGNMGLAGYFFSNDLVQAWRVAKELEVGMVGVNDPLVSTCEAPFGGIRQSGIGKEGSKYGLEEYTVIKLLSFGGLN